jgi:hypothetical protein
LAEVCEDENTPYGSPCPIGRRSRDILDSLCAAPAQSKDHVGDLCETKTEAESSDPTGLNVDSLDCSADEKNTAAYNNHSEIFLDVGNANAHHSRSDRDPSVNVVDRLHCPSSDDDSQELDIYDIEGSLSTTNNWKNEGQMAYLSNEHISDSQSNCTKNREVARSSREIDSQNPGHSLDSHCISSGKGDSPSCDVQGGDLAHKTGASSQQSDYDLYDAALRAVRGGNLCCDGCIRRKFCNDIM